MRVTHVVSGRLFGGIEQMLVTIARCRHLTPEIDHQFAVASPGRLEQELQACGAVVRFLGDVRLSRPTSVIHARADLARLLATSDPHSAAVVCHAPWAFALFAPVARRGGVPVVLWQHDHADGRSLVERWARTTRADLVICNSVWTSRTTSALQPDVAVRVIHPPVSVPEKPGSSREALRVEIGTSSNDVVILAASRLEPWKGHLNLLRALGRLADLAGWTLWIAGGAHRPHEHQYVSELRQTVRQLGIDERVRFLGERNDVPALMRAADILCQPNQGPEPFGVVLAEALLSSLPVVTVSLGGAPEIVSDACGRLVPAANQDALVDALRELIANADSRRALGARGPAHARDRVAPEVIMPALARTLESLAVKASEHRERATRPERAVEAAREGACRGVRGAKPLG
jgi:glycosyltransferase involved in cell wall biosynthesis